GRHGDARSAGRTDDRPRLVAGRGQERPITRSGRRRSPDPDHRRLRRRRAVRGRRTGADRDPGPSLARRPGRCLARRQHPARDRRSRSGQPGAAI
ncbi:MAG: hypothetical protein AVDCRST_MAG73-4231, partial [uncultured Thermomicrobiales bacterium]